MEKFVKIIKKMKNTLENFLAVIVLSLNLFQKEVVSHIQ